MPLETFTDLPGTPLHSEHGPDNREIDAEKGEYQWHALQGKERHYSRKYQQAASNDSKNVEGIHLRFVMKAFTGKEYTPAPRSMATARD